MAKHEFRVIQGLPCPKNIAPYIAIVLNDAKAQANSIYRGDDARSILNRHGHHSQYQLYHATPAQRRAWGILGTPDRPGTSTHELKSDGRAYRRPVGADLAWWQQGFDVNDWQVAAVKAAANRHHWQLFQPYPTGAEHHHLNFRVEPKPHSLKDRLRILRLRATLPRR